MKELFTNLMNLCANCEKGKFFFKDVQSPFGHTFRIFSYNYASYTDWLEPDALECRGIMFEMEGETPVRIVARPMEKFFNLNETPFTMGLDYSKVELVMAKEDGSLISSYVENDRLGLKSKGSIYSSQCLEAMQILMAPENDALHQRLLELAKDGYTCNFEYVSPTNRVVLAYQDKALVLLNVRHNDTGDYVPYPEIFKDGILRQYLVKAVEVDTSSDAFIKQIQDLEGIEGFIFVLEGGLKFKLKTKWYSALHHTKDSINNNERLFESVVAGASDDLRGMFATDEWAIKKIGVFERIHLDYLSMAIQTIESLCAKLVGKDRKDYAMTAQVELKSNPGLFGIIMQAYDKGLEVETLVEKINGVFLKNVKGFIPKEYEIPRVIEE